MPQKSCDREPIRAVAQRTPSRSVSERGNPWRSGAAPRPPLAAQSCTSIQLSRRRGRFQTCPTNQTTNTNQTTKEQSPLSWDERGASAASGVCPGRSGAIPTKPTTHPFPTDPLNKHHSAPFVGRKGRERSERGMPGAAGCLPTKPPHRPPPQPTQQPIRNPKNPNSDI